MADVTRTLIVRRRWTEDAALALRRTMQEQGLTDDDLADCVVRFVGHRREREAEAARKRRLVQSITGG